MGMVIPKDIYQNVNQMYTHPHPHKPTHTHTHTLALTQSPPPPPHHAIIYPHIYTPREVCADKGMSAEFGHSDGAVSRSSSWDEFVG
jgi:hypothetical protein